MTRESVCGIGVKPAHERTRLTRYLCRIETVNAEVGRFPVDGLDKRTISRRELFLLKHGEWANDAEGGTKVGLSILLTGEGGNLKAPPQPRH